MNIRKLPEQVDRVETGPLQFGSDWSGFFLRGDYALAIRLAISQILFNPNDPEARMQLRALKELLFECDIRKQVTKEIHA
jgi:hypothetical protein